LGERLASQTPYYRRVRFEEVQANPSRALEQLTEFCGLRPSSARLNKSAASIRPESSRQRHGLPEEVARELLSNYSMVAKLGYGLL